MEKHVCPACNHATTKPPEPKPKDKSSLEKTITLQAEALQQVIKNFDEVCKIANSNIDFKKKILTRIAENIAWVKGHNDFAGEVNRHLAGRGRFNNTYTPQEVVDILNRLLMD